MAIDSFAFPKILETSPSKPTRGLRYNEFPAIKPIDAKHIPARLRLCNAKPIYASASDILHAINRAESLPSINRVKQFIAATKKLFVSTNTSALAPSLNANSKQALKNDLKNYIANEMSRIIHQSPRKNIPSSALRDIMKIKLQAPPAAFADRPDPKQKLLRDPHPSEAIMDYAQKNQKIVNRYLSAALRQIKKTKNENFALNLENDIANELLIIQHDAFLKGIDWNTTKTHAKEHLTKKFCHSTSDGHNNLASHIIDKVLSKNPGYEIKEINTPDYSLAAKFKKSNASNPDDKRAQFTQIRTASGKVYELLNTIDETKNAKEISDLLDQHALQMQGRIVLGEGGFGKARLARDTETGEIVAVKKLRSHKEAGKEIEQFKAIQNAPQSSNNNDHLIQMFDYAHLEDKSYVFMTLAGNSNGLKLVNTIDRQDPNAEKKLKDYARKYLECIAHLHQKGIYHRDIKSENFFINNQEKGTIKIGDYGFATGEISNHCTGTPRYSPPEALLGLDWIDVQDQLPYPELSPNKIPPQTNNIDQRSPIISKYDASKHDSFSLGMTLLELKNGNLFDAQRNNTFGILNLPAAGIDELKLKTATVKFDNESFTRFMCTGIGNTATTLEGNTLDEVIARLIDNDPDTRITPKDALNLPYFRN